MAARILHKLGRLIARHLAKPLKGYSPPASTSPQALHALPYVEYRPSSAAAREHFIEDVLRVRHHSLFTPRDFDISPYFRVVKPRVENGFDPASIRWAQAGLAPVAPGQ